MELPLLDPDCLDESEMNAKRLLLPLIFAVGLVSPRPSAADCTQAQEDAQDALVHARRAWDATSLEDVRYFLKNLLRATQDIRDASSACGCPEAEDHALLAYENALLAYEARDLKAARAFLEDALESIEDALEAATNCAEDEGGEQEAPDAPEDQTV
jgi:hypothetical protein